MKKIQTYGKYRTKNVVVDDWDELVAESNTTKYFNFNFLNLCML